MFVMTPPLARTLRMVAVVPVARLARGRTVQLAPRNNYLFIHYRNPHVSHKWLPHCAPQRQMHVVFAAFQF